MIIKNSDSRIWLKSILIIWLSIVDSCKVSDPYWTSQTSEEPMKLFFSAMILMVDFLRLEEWIFFFQSEEAFSVLKIPPYQN